MKIPLDILEKISSVTTIAKLLALYALYVSKKVPKEVIAFLRKKIKEMVKKQKYGYIPSDEYATQLFKISRSDAYRRLKACIGNHSTLRLIKTGLYIYDLNAEGQQKVVESIREEVFQSFGDEGIAILDMGSTGAIVPIIERISELKIHGYPTKDLIRRYELMIRKWREISLLVTKDTTKESVKRFCLRKMEGKWRIFWVIASGSASIPAYTAIAELNNDGEFNRYGYIFGNKKRVSKMNMEFHTWSFELA